MTNQEFVESIRLEGEEWKDVVGYENLYLVSSLGRVISTKYLHFNKQQLLHPCNQTNKGKEYSYVCLSKNGKSKKVRVHRLVAIAFLENPCGYKEIDHINGNGVDNTVSNLRWCSRLQNMNNPITKDRLNKTRFAIPTSIRSRPLAKIWNGEVVAVYKRLKDVEKDGFLPTSVCAVCHSRKRSYKGFEWKYLS